MKNKNRNQRKYLFLTCAI